MGTGIGTLTPTIPTCTRDAKVRAEGDVATAMREVRLALLDADVALPVARKFIKEAQAKGFDNAVMRDGTGNVVEFGTSNLWYAKDGVAVTPAANGTFLVGVTRNRLIDLFEQAGIEVREETVRPEDLTEADEIFSTGNLGKVLPITRLDDRDLQPGPIFSKARELYFNYAKGETV